LDIDVSADADLKYKYDLEEKTDEKHIYVYNTHSSYNKNLLQTETLPQELGHYCYSCELFNAWP
jgi:hypothetical protein